MFYKTIKCFIEIKTTLIGLPKFFQNVLIHPWPDNTESLLNIAEIVLLLHDGDASSSKMFFMLFRYMRNRQIQI